MIKRKKRKYMVSFIGLCSYIDIEAYDEIEAYKIARKALKIDYSYIFPILRNTIKNYKVTLSK